MEATHEDRASLLLVPDESPLPDGHFLHEVIRVVSSTLDLDDLLGGIVDLLSRAMRCHACYVFLPDLDGRLVLRACSDPRQAGHLGRTALERGEGIAGWVAEHLEPVFISRDATSDPRMKLFPEFEEEKYQSLVSVPLVAKDSSVLGVVALHTEAPHDYTSDDARFLVTSASLVAGAIENARLHEETTQRVRALEELCRLSAQSSHATRLPELVAGVAERATFLLDAASCELFLLERDRTRLRRAASDPPLPVAVASLEELGLSQVAEALKAGLQVDAAIRQEAGDVSRLSAPMVVAGELVGVLVADGHPGRRFRPEHLELARSIASQVAVSAKKIELVERLTERNLAHDFLEDLASGSGLDGIEARSRRLRCDLSQPQLALLAAGAGDDPDWGASLEAALVAGIPGIVVARSDQHLRAIVPAAGEVPDALAMIASAHRAAGFRATIGVSSVCIGAPSFAMGFEEAQKALDGAVVVLGGPGVLAFEDLGPYKYLLRVPADCFARDRHCVALRALVAYDREHRSELLKTLEEYLRGRGRVAPTAERLYLHPNSLRQRLGRIEAITGLSLKQEDLVTLDMAMRLLRLEDARS